MVTAVIPATDPARLGSLLAVEETPRVSIVMPVHPTDPQQDAIRARGITGRTRMLLAAHDVAGDVADPIIASLQHALTHLHPLPRTTGAVAVYATPGTLDVVPLPGGEELITAGPEFHLLPLIDAADTIHVHALTLTRGGCALWRVDRHGITEIALPGAPGALSEVTRYRDLEKQLQFHQTARGGAAVFHGHALGENRELEPIRVYLRAIDQAVATSLAGDGAPLVLVGPGSLPGLFRDVTTHPAVAPHPVEIHPDGIDGDALHRSAAPLVADLVADRTRRFLDRVGALRPLRRSSTLPAEILMAAALGRVDTLLVDPAAETAALTNRAAVAALRHRATVLPAPGLEPDLAAVFRW